MTHYSIDPETQLTAADAIGTAEWLDEYVRFNYIAIHAATSDRDLAELAHELRTIAENDGDIVLNPDAVRVWLHGFREALRN